MLVASILFGGRENTLKAMALGPLLRDTLRLWLAHRCFSRAAAWAYDAVVSLLQSVLSWGMLSLLFDVAFTCQWHVMAEGQKTRQHERFVHA